MTTIHNAGVQASIATYPAGHAKSGKKNEGPEAALSQLSQTLEKVLGQLTPPTAKASDSKIVHVDFNANENPTNGDMQGMIGKLMELLTELQGDIAKYGYLNAQANSKVGNALVAEMNAQVKQVQKDLMNAAETQKRADFWHTFLEWIGGIVAAVVTVLSFGSGSILLPVIIGTLTVLSMTGEMTKLTQAIADAISKDLQKQGYPKDKADIIAKIIADVIVIAATVAVTAGASGVGVAAEQSESALANKLFKILCQTIVAETQVVASTNFGSDLMAAILIKMKESNTKETLQTVMGAIIDIVAVIAGICFGGMSIATAQDATRFPPSLMKALGALLAIGSLTQATGQAGSAATSFYLAGDTLALGESNGLLSELQALVRRSSQQSASDSKAEISKQKIWAENLSSLAAELNRESAALANVLRA